MILIIGAGLTGATIARQLKDAGRDVVVWESREHIGGNCHTETRGGVIVSTYGGHIFHTNARRIWNYVQRFAEWQQYEHRVKVSYKGKIYSFPPNLMTYSQMGLKPGVEADMAIRRTFFEGYTAKQWGREIADVPGDYVKRIPYRQTWDDRYFADEWQGLPVGGYTPMVAEMLLGIPVVLGRRATLADFDRFSQVVYTGPLDTLFERDSGMLEYRSLKFVHEYRMGYNQGTSTVNFVEREVPYTKILQWSYFWRHPHPETVGQITTEYPAGYTGGQDEMPYYPIETERNRELHQAYLSRLPAHVRAAGRLGRYQYLNMDQAIGAALAVAEGMTK